MHALKLNNTGIAHYLALVVIVLGVVIGGAYYLMRSYADTCRTASCSKPATAISATWAGYQATVPDNSTKRFTAAGGEFTVPTIVCDPTNEQEAYESFSQWVGLDGVNNENLVQAGVEAHCVANNSGGFSAIYFPWWEVIQGAQNDVWKGRQFPVKPGDKMSVSVSFANGKYTISLKDKTTNKGFKQVKTCTNSNNSPCPRSSAEWVIERPGGANMHGYGGVLANFGKTSFSKVSARLSSSHRTLNLKQVHAEKVTMTEGDLDLAKVSSTNKQYNGFTLQYLNHGTTTATVPH